MYKKMRLNAVHNQDNLHTHISMKYVHLNGNYIHVYSAMPNLHADNSV